jgi:hypothetical protein
MGSIWVSLDWCNNLPEALGWVIWTPFITAFSSHHLHQLTPAIAMQIGACTSEPHTANLAFWVSLDWSNNLPEALGWVVWTPFINYSFLISSSSSTESCNSNAVS